MERERAGRLDAEKKLLAEQAQVAGLKGELETAKKQLVVLKGGLDKAQAETTNERAQAAAARAELERQIAKLKKDLADLQGQSSSQLAALNADLAAKAAEAKRQKANADNAYLAYQREVKASDATKQDMAKLLLSLQDAESALTKLRSEYATVSTDRTALSSKLEQERRTLEEERRKHRDLAAESERLTGVNERFLEAMATGKKFHLWLAGVLLAYVVVISAVVAWWGYNIRPSLLGGDIGDYGGDRHRHANAHLTFFSKAASVTRRTFPPTVLSSIGFTIVSTGILAYALLKSDDSPVFALMLQQKSWEILAVFLAPAAVLVAVYTFVETRYAEAIKAVAGGSSGDGPPSEDPDPGGNGQPKRKVARAVAETPAHLREPEKRVPAESLAGVSAEPVPDEPMAEEEALAAPEADEPGQRRRVARSDRQLDQG